VVGCFLSILFLEFESVLSVAIWAMSLLKNSWVGGGNVSLLAEHVSDVP